MGPTGGFRLPLFTVEARHILAGLQH
jgi:hypothetical protein